jgi:hypothetical protein
MKDRCGPGARKAVSVSGGGGTRPCRDHTQASSIVVSVSSEPVEDSAHRRRPGLEGHEVR